MSKPKFIPADCKAIALAAFLFYSEREYNCELLHDPEDPCLVLRVTYEDTMRLEDCPLLNCPFIKVEKAHVGYSDKVTSWFIPIAKILL